MKTMVNIWMSYQSKNNAVHKSFDMICEKFPWLTFLICYVLDMWLGQAMSNAKELSFTFPGFSRALKTAEITKTSRNLKFSHAQCLRKKPA